MATITEPQLTALRPAPDLYRWLLANADLSVGDAFDRHVVASIMAISLRQWQAGERDHGDWIGLETAALDELVRTMFPTLSRQLPTITDGEIRRSADENCLYQLLCQYASPRGRLQCALAAMIARRALWPNHLWQDLGLANRGELSQLLRRHFAPLAARNVHNLRWKKFFYRQICSDAAFLLCSAPVCSECDDYDDCFAPEEAAASDPLARD